MAEEFNVDDLSDVVDQLATGIYSVTRSGPTTFTKGRRDAPTTSTLEVRAVVYPVSGRTLDRLPEGLRTHEAISIVTKTELKTAETGGEPDKISVNGGLYQVQAVDRWQPSGNFYRVLATRVPTL